MTIEDILHYLNGVHFNSKCKEGLDTNVIFEHEGKQYTLDKYYEFDSDNIVHIDLEEIDEDE